MDLLALLHERLTGEHPVKKALERLHAAGEPNPLFALGELALARLENFSTYPAPLSGTALELEESKFEFSAEERAEIANALRTKEHLIRSGFYDETADGLDITRWAGVLAHLANRFAQHLEPLDCTKTTETRSKSFNAPEDQTTFS